MCSGAGHRDIGVQHLKQTKNMKLKKGDNVIMIAGKDKGKKGKISKSIPSMNKVVVEGINIMKKHQRPRKSGEKGSVINMSMPVHASNVKKLI